MNKYRRTSLLLLLILLVITLSGCGTKEASQDAYKLPLGDSGYISEIDFSLSKNVEKDKDESGKVTSWIKYSYVSRYSTYTSEIKFGTIEEKFIGKMVKMEAGYYENNHFISYENASCYIKLENAGATGSITFTPDRTDAVIKLAFGTSVDEEVYKKDNPNAKKSEVNKYVKAFRGASVVVSSLTLTNGSITNTILSEPVVNAEGVVQSYVGKTNSDLYFYNTSTVSWASTTDNGGNKIEGLTLTLNYKGGPWQWIIKELGALLNWITQLVGGFYWLGLLILTIIVRTAGWPIYAKSNSTTAKMTEIQPEIQKINDKYQGKTDQNSKMKQQLETKELMKKNHVSMFGCLMPFLQMPIFFAIYQVVERFPLTPMYTFSTNFNFLWTNFGATYGSVSGDWILALIVGVTMLASQEIGLYMTKRIQAKKKNFYTAKNHQSNTQMRIMSGVMTVMMVVFAWRSAGMAFYWIIGNIYQTFQTYISKKQEEKVALKKQRALGRPEGR